MSCSLCISQVIGNLHGQYFDLLRFFKKGGFPPKVSYIFLGNYVDMAKHSLEIICLLLAYKIKFPDMFFLLRGNRECAATNRIHGFYGVRKRRCNAKLWKEFIKCFNYLPLAAIIKDSIFLTSGGLSPDLNTMDQIHEIVRPTDVRTP